ncbi:hypothetical protein P4679_24630 [Priestia megaterium]|uniref:hypothetical protein n=1 Tax=Priestia megaterium TaxID=1404 RepID=UPI002E250EB1|nr:hypothetical protein [Priestia megaterium]
MLDPNKFNYNNVQAKWFDKQEISSEEISGIFGLVEAKEDRLVAIYNILDSIPVGYCTPLVKKKIEAALSIIKD